MPASDKGSFNPLAFVAFVATAVGMQFIVIQLLNAWWRSDGLKGDAPISKEFGWLLSTGAGLAAGAIVQRVFGDD